MPRFLQIVLATGLAVIAGPVFVLSPAFALSVDVKKGAVSLSKGQGFEGITGSNSAEAGNIVMTGPNGEAEIVYDNGCHVIVRARRTVKIDEEPPCGELPYLHSAEECMLTIGAVTVGGLIGGVLLLNDGGGRPASP